MNHKENENELKQRCLQTAVCPRKGWSLPLRVKHIQTIRLTPFTAFSITKGKKSQAFSWHTLVQHVPHY